MPTKYRSLGIFGSHKLREYRVGDDATAWSRPHVRDGEEIALMRSNGMSWESIAHRLSLCNRSVAHHRWRRLLSSPWTLLKQQRMQSGHLLVRIGGRTGQIGRFILEAFVSPCQDGTECCHNDGDPSNNTLSNLRWDIRSENIMDRVLHGCHAAGERHGMHKLSESQVRVIRKSRGPRAELSKQFGVTVGTIYKIRSKRLWGNVQ